MHTHPDYSEHLEPEADEEFGLSLSLVREITQALEDEAPDRIRELVLALHASDLAELFNVIDTELREKLTHLVSEHFDPEVLAYLQPEVRDEVMDHLGPDKSAEAIAELDTDDAVHVVEDLSEEDQQEILEAVPEETRETLIESLTYPEESAGRLMRRDFVTIPEKWTVGDVVDYLRSKQEDVPEDFYVIFVVDDLSSPVGSVLLSRVMQNKREVKVNDIMTTDLKRISTDTDQEEVARVFRKYGLVESPVVNEGGRLVGTITVDDVVDVIQEESEEDLLKMGGVSASDFHAGTFETVRRRLPWLIVNLALAAVAVSVIGMFEGTIAHLVTLAVLMPVIASMGGNAGIQAVTVAVRAIATRELTPANTLIAVRKELLTGIANGIALAAVTGAAIWWWYGNPKLAYVFAAAMVITLLFGGLFGALIPILLDRMKVDPAVASGVFMTVTTDVISFLSFLGLATWLIL